MQDDDTTAPVEDVQAAVDNDVPATDVNDDAPVEADITEPSEAPQASQEEPAVPEADDKLRQFARSQGIELDSPNAIKAAQALQKARSEATRNHHKAAELEKTANITAQDLPADATPQQMENARIRNLEMKYELSDWRRQNPDKTALESQMVEVLADPSKKLLLAEGYLSYDEVYALAKAKAPDNTAAVKSQAKRETLESLAHKQTAAVPRGNATTQGTPKQKPFSEMTRAEMKAHLGVHKR